MDRIGRIAGVAQRHVDAGALSHVEWRLLRHGSVWTQGRYGLADSLTGKALPDKPIYRIFSMTKPVVSAVAMMLIEQGRLRLFDPLAAYLPEFSSAEVLHEDGSREPAGMILIEHLLTHRAGFSYGFLMDCPVAALYRQADLRDTTMPLAEFVSQVAALPLAYQPGSQWRYSVATDVLARVLEVICGKTLPEIVQNYLLDPLGLVDTGFHVAPEQAARILPMFGKTSLDDIMVFDAAAQVLVPADMSQEQPHDNPGFYRGGTGLFSTLEDYCEIAKFLHKGRATDGTRLLSPAALGMMWRDRIPENQKPLTIGAFEMPGIGWGLAGQVIADPARAMFLCEKGSYGWAGAASTYFWVDPANDLIGVVMCQYLGSKIPIGEDFQTAVYQALVE